MSKFLTELEVSLKDDDKIWILTALLIYQSDLLGTIAVPTGFETDFASVPRVPFVFESFGDRAHRESVIHDYLYRIDSIPIAKRRKADRVFLEAMKVRGKGFFVRGFMFLGVVIGGFGSYHKRKVGDKL